MTYSQQAYNLIRREAIPLITEDWQSVYLTIHIATEDLSTSYEGTYHNIQGEVNSLPGYSDGWDLHVLVGKWFEHDSSVYEQSYHWNKIQFEIDQEGYAAVTTWDQAYYDHVYPNR